VDTQCCDSDVERLSMSNVTSWHSVSWIETKPCQNLLERVGSGQLQVLGKLTAKVMLGYNELVELIVLHGW